jgi:hypothetical protein
MGCDDVRSDEMRYAFVGVPPQPCIDDYPFISCDDYLTLSESVHAMHSRLSRVQLPFIRVISEYLALRVCSTSLPEVSMLLLHMT